MFSKRLITLLICTLSGFQFSIAQTQNLNSSQIELGLEKLNTLGTVLYIAAHPDDENTRLLSYFANERHYRACYLSLTRGDGGQNLIGKQQGEELGMIRTQELLAARRIDGAEQFFTRANDFGFSKNPEETFRFWGKDTILEDVVWIIRLLKPDVIINRFPTTGEGGHGHHTASAILSVEAFKAAADPLRFPDQLKYVQPWQAKRLLFNSFNFRNQPPQDYKGQLDLEVGSFNPLLGESYGEISAESRSMHKSQGFGVPRSRGSFLEHFKPLDGDTVITEVFQRITTTWDRLPDSKNIKTKLEKILTSYNPSKPYLILNDLLELRTDISELKDEYWKKVKLKEIDKLITSCAALWVEANSDDYYVSPDDTMKINFTVISALVPGIKIEKISCLGFDTLPQKDLKQNEPFVFSKTLRIPGNYTYTNPYWLQQPHTDYLYTVTDRKQVGRPENEPSVIAQFDLSINGHPFTINKEINYKWTDPVKGEIYRPFEIVPAVSIHSNDALMLLAPGEKHEIQVTIKSLVGNFNGKLKLETPQNWSGQPGSIDVALDKKGAEKNYRFQITNNNKSNVSVNQTAKATFVVTGIDKKYQSEIRRIEFDHIPDQVHLKDATIKLVDVNLKSKVHRIGYIEGAGDEVAHCLSEAGLEVVTLTDNMLMNESLDSYEAIVTGVRTYNINEKMGLYYDKLMKYIENGGNLIIQYNTNNFLSTVSSKIGPYPFTISRDRVTDEHAAPILIDPENEIFKSPNMISANDFEGWVQERGLYFATDISPEYHTLISWNDAGEKPLNGGLITTKYGKGNFVYTGISFFRQLPAGVPGAYRLILNLINLGK